MKRPGPMIVLAVVGVALLGALVYWPTGRGEEPSLDEKVTQQWMAGRESQDAVMFFEQGGMYEELQPKGEIDQKHVLPLVRRLRDEFQLKPVVALTEPGRAMGLFIKLPKEAALRRRIGTALQEADDAFPGLLTDHWGEEWLSLDWLDERELPALERSGVLEPITAEHERIRKNP